MVANSFPQTYNCTSVGKKNPTAHQWGGNWKGQSLKVVHVTFSSFMALTWREVLCPVCPVSLVLDRIRENLWETASGRDLFNLDLFPMRFLSTGSQCAVLPTKMPNCFDLERLILYFVDFYTECNEYSYTVVMVKLYFSDSYGKAYLLRFGSFSGSLSINNLWSCSPLPTTHVPYWTISQVPL